MTTELRQQILNPSEVVKQLTALKYLHQHEPETASFGYLMMIRTSQHWIPKQTHLWWVSRAAPLSRLTRKQPHPVKNPPNLSVPSCVHSVKFTKKACRPCFLPKRLQQDYFCSLLTRTSLINVTQPHSKRWAASQSNYNCSEGNWFVYCRPCFCWSSLCGRRDGEVQNVSY